MAKKPYKKKENEKEPYTINGTSLYDNTSFSGYITSGTVTAASNSILTYASTGTTTWNITYGGSLSNSTTITGDVIYDVTDNTVHFNTGSGYVQVANGLSYSTSYGSDVKIFENDHINISDNGDILINGKKELNPLKIGHALLKAVESLRKENLNKPKDFFN